MKKIAVAQEKQTLRCRSGFGGCGIGTKFETADRFAKTRRGAFLRAYCELELAARDGSVPTLRRAPLHEWLGFCFFWLNRYGKPLPCQLSFLFAFLVCMVRWPKFSHPFTP